MHLSHGWFADELPEISMTQDAFWILKKDEKTSRKGKESRLLQWAKMSLAFMFFDYLFCFYQAIVFKNIIKIRAYGFNLWRLRFSRDFLGLLTKELVLQICEEALALLLAILLQIACYYLGSGLALGLLVRTVIQGRTFIPSRSQNRRWLSSILFLDDDFLILLLLLIQIFVQKLRDHYFHALRLLLLTHHLAFGADVVYCVWILDFPPGCRFWLNFSRGNLCLILLEGKRLLNWFKTKTVVRYLL